MSAGIEPGRRLACDAVRHGDDLARGAGEVEARAAVGQRGGGDDEVEHGGAPVGVVSQRWPLT